MSAITVFLSVCSCVLFFLHHLFYAPLPRIQLLLLPLLELLLQVLQRQLLLVLEDPSPPARLSARRIVHMGGQVLGQVVGARETLAARLAVVRPLAGVDAQVARQIGFAAERAAAEQTDERPLAGVLAHVQLQVLLRADALAAERAGEATAERRTGR